MDISKGEMQSWDVPGVSRGCPRTSQDVPGRPRASQDVPRRPGTHQGIPKARLGTPQDTTRKSLKPLSKRASHVLDRTPSLKEARADMSFGDGQVIVILTRGIKDIFVQSGVKVAQSRDVLDQVAPAALAAIVVDVCIQALGLTVKHWLTYHVGL